MIKQMDVGTLAKKLEQGERLFLLDVRGHDEVTVGSIGGTVIPLPELPARIDEVPRDVPVVVICKAGGRSQRACELLAAAGFAEVSNVVGGMLQWQARIDPQVQVK